MTQPSNIGLIFLAIGGVSAIAAILLFLRARRFLGSAVSVQGTVTDMAQRSSSEGGVVHSPVVQFTTVEGQAHTFTDSVGSSPPKYTPGDAVKVMYPPGNPEGARIPSWFRMWFLPSFSALFAVIFLGVGFFLYTTASDVEDVLSDLPVPDELASLLPEFTPGAMPGLTPGALPSGITEGNAVLVIKKGAGAPLISPVSCESVRDIKGGRVRDVRLTAGGETLSFKASPFTGPGPYTPGANLEVDGSIFERNAAVTGAVIFDDTGQAGVVNLVGGESSASGAWDCKDVKI